MRALPPGRSSAARDPSRPLRKWGSDPGVRVLRGQAAVTDPCFCYASHTNEPCAHDCHAVTVAARAKAEADKLRLDALKAEVR